MQKSVALTLLYPGQKDLLLPSLDGGMTLGESLDILLRFGVQRFTEDFATRYRPSDCQR